MSIDEDITFLERVPLLGPLGRAALRVLAIGSETQHIGAGDVLFVAGEPADAGYLIQEGSFGLLPDSAGEAAREVAAGRGTLLGELALIAESVRPATATALEPATVMRISRTLFLKMLDGYPDAARRLRDAMMARVDQSARDIQRVHTAFAKLDGKD